jgi:hypothetical protein
VERSLTATFVWRGVRRDIAAARLETRDGRPAILIGNAERWQQIVDNPRRSSPN